MERFDANKMDEYSDASYMRHVNQSSHSTHMYKEGQIGEMSSDK